jgi:hypothetical protein
MIYLYDNIYWGWGACLGDALGGHVGLVVKNAPKVLLVRKHLPNKNNRQSIID